MYLTKFYGGRVNKVPHYILWGEWLIKYLTTFFYYLLFFFLQCGLRAHTSVSLADPYQWIRYSPTEQPLPLDLVHYTEHVAVHTAPTRLAWGDVAVDNHIAPTGLAWGDVAVDNHIAPTGLALGDVAVHNHTAPIGLAWGDVAVHNHTAPTGLAWGDVAVDYHTAPAGLAWGDVAVDNHTAPRMMQLHLKVSKCDQFGSVWTSW